MSTRPWDVILGFKRQEHTALFARPYLEEFLDFCFQSPFAQRSCPFPRGRFRRSRAVDIFRC